MNCLRKYLCVKPANMVQLWGFTLLLLASLCVVHTRPYEEEKHRALQRTGYVYVEGVGYYRIASSKPEVWAEARRQCQQEGATLAVVNSELEAQTLRDLYLNDVRHNVKKRDWDVYDDTTADPTTPDLPTTEPAPTDTTLHIGFHDIFIEGEYLTVRSEPIIMTGFIRWKVGHPIGDEAHNCGGFDIEKFLLDNPCDVKLPYICEIPEAS